MRLRAPWSEVSGVFVGGCVARGEGSSFRGRAHAHNNPKDAHFGWVCIRARWRVGVIADASDHDWDGDVVKAGETLVHEYAHILVPNQGHTPRFSRVLLTLPGHRINAHEKTLKAFQTAHQSKRR